MPPGGVAARRVQPPCGGDGPRQPLARPTARDPAALFEPGDDPGPSFADLLRRVGLAAAGPDRPRSTPARHHPRHHRRRHPLRRRRGHGRRPPGDVRQPHLPPRRWRRCSPPTATPASPSPAPPGPAMEMVKLFQLQLEHYEKVEGADALASRARPTSSRQMVRSHLPAGHAGPRRRAALRRLRHAPAAWAACSSTTSPAAATRRATSPPPARAACTPARSSSSATATASTGATRSTWPSPRCSRRPTRTRPPAVPTWSAASTRSSPRSPPTASAGSPTTRSPSASGRMLDQPSPPRSTADRGHQPDACRRSARR